MQTKAINPDEMFGESVVKATCAWLDELPKDKIEITRRAYKRELNASNELNELPEHTQNMRRCFLFLSVNSQY